MKILDNQITGFMPLALANRILINLQLADMALGYKLTPIEVDYIASEENIYVLNWDKPF